MLEEEWNDDAVTVSCQHNGSMVRETVFNFIMVNIDIPIAMFMIIWYNLCR